MSRQLIAAAFLVAIVAAATPTARAQGDVAQCPLAAESTPWPLDAAARDGAMPEPSRARESMTDACIVSLDAVPADALLVDTRSRAEFDAMAASGSINIPVGELLSNAIPGYSSVVLLGTGKQDSALLSVCDRLRERNPKRSVQVLAGGLRVLARSRSLVGDTSRMIALFHLDAGEIRRVMAGAPRARVLSVGSDPVKGDDDTTAQIVHFDAIPGAWKLRRALRDLSPTQPLVLAGAAGTFAELRERVERITGRTDVLTYEGGGADLIADAIRDQAIAESRSWVRPISCDLN